MIPITSRLLRRLLLPRPADPEEWRRREERRRLALARSYLYRTVLLGRGLFEGRRGRVVQVRGERVAVEVPVGARTQIYVCDVEGVAMVDPPC